MSFRSWWTEKSKSCVRQNAIDFSPLHNVHACTHTQKKHTCTHTDTHTHTHTHTFTRSHKQTCNTNTNLDVYPTHTHTHRCIYQYKQIHTNNTQNHADKLRHKYTHTYKQTHLSFLNDTCNKTESKWTPINKETHTFPRTHTHARTKANDACTQSFPFSVPSNDNSLLLLLLFGWFQLVSWQLSVYNRIEWTHFLVSNSTSSLTT